MDGRTFETHFIRSTRRSQPKNNMYMALKTASVEMITYLILLILSTTMKCVVAQHMQYLID